MNQARSRYCVSYGEIIMNISRTDFQIANSYYKKIHKTVVNEFKDQIQV